MQLLMHVVVDLLSCFTPPERGVPLSKGLTGLHTFMRYCLVNVSLCARAECHKLGVYKGVYRTATRNMAQTALKHTHDLQSQPRGYSKSTANGVYRMRKHARARVRTCCALVGGMHMLARVRACCCALVGGMHMLHG
eukprot:366522-Chlamydomonas_euryale.AAC.20